MKGTAVLRLLLAAAVVPVPAIAASDYETPEAFKNLFEDFTGSHQPGYPAGKTSIAQTLYEAETANSDLSLQTGPLILFVDSTLYIYDAKGGLELTRLMRTAPDSGFTEMTAISHIGPALAYLARVKELGGTGWKEQLEGLLNDIKAVKAVNTQADDNWLTRVDAPAWKPYAAEVRNMVDYACSTSGSYIRDVIDGKSELTMVALQREFLDGKGAFPIPFNTVMVATFMLTALQSMTAIHDQVAPLGVDWPKAKVIIRFVAGSNVTAGVSAQSNWLVPFVTALSNNTLPGDRIFIAPYAEVRPSLGQASLSAGDFAYYDTVWTSVYNRTHIARTVFTGIPDIETTTRPPIPGDYGYSRTSDIGDFLMRLKHSLSEPTEMLSNTVAFWMAGELAAKNWDAGKVEIPGLTSGLPEGVHAYPENNPAID